MSNSDDIKVEIRRQIERGQLDSAIDLCNQIDDSDPDYYFLQARAFADKGWTQRARDYVKIATQMDPGNSEYQMLWQRLEEPAQQYRAQSQQQGYTRPNNCSCCDVLTCACCSDCCCESMGGDLIPCC